MVEARCSNCGALVAADAEWCGQCYEPLRSDPSARSGPAPERPGDGDSVAAIETPGGGQVEVSEGRAAWTCPVCGEHNPIDNERCSVCGTSFTRLFVAPEPVPSVEPDRAAAWSLVFPGLGHWKLGRRADAVARIVLFAWTFGTLAVILGSRFGKGGLGATMPLFLLFAAASAAVYVLSAADAYRLARGDDPLIGSRPLLWGSAALVVLSVLLATLVTLPAARR